MLVSHALERERYTVQMGKSRCLGLLGGVGVGATAHYYRELAAASEAHGLELDLVMVHAEVPRVVSFVEANDLVGLETYFNGFFARMKAAGADVAAIPSVASHFCHKQLAASAPLPVITLFHPIAEEAAQRSIRRVAIFGTRFVIESELYGAVPGLTYIRPRNEEVDQIHNIYMRLALDGKGTETQNSDLTDLAIRLLNREHLDAIILGGTDLCLLFNARNTSFPVIDCAALHIQAIAQAIF